MSDTTKVSFWRIFWPSLIAGIALILLAFIFFSSLISSSFSKKPTYSVKDKTVLHLTLDGTISELGKSAIDFDLSGVKLAREIGLADILYGFEKAANDNQVKGIFIELDRASCGYATAKAIRDAIKTFEEQSGKFVVAYHHGEAISLKEYYIASAAQENYGFHSSTFEFLGLGAELMFYKGLLDKLDIEMQVIRGSNNDFKSAVEPFFLSEMSDSSRLQLETYLENIWTAVKEDISEDRGLTTEELDSIADNGLVRRVSQAVKYKLIDDTKYRDEVIKILTEKAGATDEDDLQLSSFEKYAKKNFELQQTVANAKSADIAVIIAEGDVTVDGDGLASNRITKLFQKARKDKNIKAVVLRINSPGGSALASDEIWREVNLTNQEKPVIVSMGDVAASGGYYIATPATKIFAQKNTITGSIGVFGVIPYAGKMLENQLGISFDRVGTNKHANAVSLTRKLSSTELSMVQDEVDMIYTEFLQRVSDGRNLSLEKTNEIARGRVWTGVDALRVGLVDTIGGIESAIAYAKTLVEVEKPVVRYYPKVKRDEWMEFIEDAMNETENSLQSTQALPEEVTALYKRLKKIEEMTGIQARMPYEIIW